MKKLFCAIGVMAMLLASCNSSKKEAAQALEESRIMKIDSLVTQIDSVKTDIDSSMKEVDQLINEL